MGAKVHNPPPHAHDRFKPSETDLEVLRVIRIMYRERDQVPPTEDQLKAFYWLRNPPGRNAIAYLHANLCADKVFQNLICLGFIEVVRTGWFWSRGPLRYRLTHKGYKLVESYDQEVVGALALTSPAPPPFRPQPVDRRTGLP